MAHPFQAPAATAPNAAMPMMPGMANLQHLGKVENRLSPFLGWVKTFGKKGKKGGVCEKLLKKGCLGSGFTDFLDVFILKIGEMMQSDEHIFLKRSL